MNNQIKNILIDIDNTITDSIDEGIDPFRQSCIELMLEKNNILSIESVGKAVDKAFETGGGLMEPALAHLQIPLMKCWKRIVQGFEKSVSVFPDADFLLKELKKQNFDVYPATTNSSFAILAKLAVGGLAEEMKTSYFKTILGGSEVHPKGKSGPFFYTALVERLNIKPEEVLMIGDNLKADGEFALTAGIKHVVIIDRSQVEDFICDENGVLFVNSLKHVIKIIDK
jgi:phosphoglycolate phosphatase-like HAD superfamily hydrolase